MSMPVICLFIVLITAWIKFGLVASIGITAGLIVVMPHPPKGPEEP